MARKFDEFVSKKTIISKNKFYVNVTNDQNICYSFKFKKLGLSLIDEENHCKLCLKYGNPVGIDRVNFYKFNYVDILCHLNRHTSLKYQPDEGKRVIIGDNIVDLDLELKEHNQLELD